MNRKQNINTRTTELVTHTKSGATVLLITTEDARITGTRPINAPKPVLSSHATFFWEIHLVFRIHPLSQLHPTAPTTELLYNTISLSPSPPISLKDELQVSKNP